MPFDPMQNINTALGRTPSPEEIGAHAVAQHLGTPMTNAAPVELVTLGKGGETTLPTTGGGSPLPTLPGAGGSPTMTPLGTSSRDVIKAAATMATEDAHPAQHESAPPLVLVPTVAAGIGVPEGAGVPEYNVTTPYGGGPGVNVGDYQPPKTDAQGRRVLDVSVGAKSKASPSWLLWAGLAAAAWLLFAD